jgi:hypothetical protein
MARPRVPIGTRPACPIGHNGDIWLDGYYARGQFHERPRWICLPRLDAATRKRPPFHPDGSRSHKFVEPLPRRHPTATHPLGGATCVECERVLDRHEGPQTVRRQIFSIREIASALVEVSHGRSLRKASAAARDSAQRLITDPWGQLRPSRHGQLTADQLAMFGTVVRDELMPDAWPDEVALDETSVGITLTETDAQGQKHTHATSLYILGVYGYAAGRGSGRAIRLAARGGYDRVEWEAVLRSRPGSPSWVVCDGGKSVKAAVKRVWPEATLYTCEGHLKMLVEDNLAADGHDRQDPLALGLSKAVAGRKAWEDLEQRAAAAGAAQTLAWMRKKRGEMERQWAVRDRSRTLSIGGLEQVFEAVKNRLADRRYVFRNQARLELIFDLMALDLAGLATEFRFRQVIRRHLLAHGGRPTTARRALDDRGGSSLHAVVREAERRLAKRRTQNAKAQRASVQRQRAAGGAPPKRRSRRPRRLRTGAGK